MNDKKIPFCKGMQIKCSIDLLVKGILLLSELQKNKLQHFFYDVNITYLYNFNSLLSRGFRFRQTISLR